MRKIFLLTTGVAGLLLLTACGSASSATVEDTSSSSSLDQMSSQSDMSSSSVDTGTTSSVPDATSSVSSDAPQARVINMTVESFKFTPNMVTVHKGENVVIHLTSLSGIHSFLSEDLGINVPIQTGETKDIVVPTDTAGTFSFRCGVPCGPGHREMIGEIVVQ